MKDISVLYNRKEMRNLLLKCTTIRSVVVNSSDDAEASNSIEGSLIASIKAARNEPQPPNEVLRGFLLIPKTLTIGSDMGCYYFYFESLTDMNEWQTGMSIKEMKMVQIDIHRSNMILPKPPSFKCAIININGGLNRLDKITIIGNEIV